MIVSNKPLQLASIKLKDFRCFKEYELDLNSSVVLIHGLNGAGKTSILEALYYACYLRSFRTHLAKDLILIGKESFFLKITLTSMSDDNSFNHTIAIGFAGSKRLVKINNKSTVSYKDLLEYYRIVSLTEDDLSLIKGGPQERRVFIDQALMLDDATFISLSREFYLILEQRNSLLQNMHIDEEAYYIWSHKLWHHTQLIQNMRRILLKKYELYINEFLKNFFNEEVSVSFSYNAKKVSNDSFEQFWHDKNQLLLDEKYVKRSLFGAHLDDFFIVFEGKKSKAFASRGQQKMIVLLLKVAQIKELIDSKKESVVFLLDDFLTDFDASKAKKLLSILLSLNCQLIFTSPHKDSTIECLLKNLMIAHKSISI